jgi:hypothetical protein
MVASSLLIFLIRVPSFRLDGLTGKLPDIGWREALARHGLKFNDIALPQ